MTPTEITRRTISMTYLEAQKQADPSVPRLVRERLGAELGKEVALDERLFAEKKTPDESLVTLDILFIPVEAFGDLMNSLIGENVRLTEMLAEAERLLDRDSPDAADFLARLHEELGDFDSEPPDEADDEPHEPFVSPSFQANPRKHH